VTLQTCVCFEKMTVKGTDTRGFLSGYFDGLQQTERKERYSAKLKDINGQDPYEIPKNEWPDDLESWPGVTHILLFKSINTRADYELQKLGLLSELCQRMGSRGLGKIVF